MLTNSITSNIRVTYYWYNEQGKGNSLFGKERSVMCDEMTNTEFNAFLEILASLVEAKAKTPEEAAELIRQVKAT